MNENNFTLTIGKWFVAMVNGELEINNCVYDSQDQEDDPTYDFVRELWRLKTGAK